MNYFAPITAHPALACAALLTVSNLFMTFAWYGHLKHLQASPWWTAALVSWGIALFEYMLQVPANRGRAELERVRDRGGRGRTLFQQQACHRLPRPAVGRMHRGGCRAWCAGGRGRNLPDVFHNTSVTYMGAVRQATPVNS